MAGPLAAARAVLFDLDGTLVDSLPDIAGHLQQAMLDEGLAAPTVDEVRRWVGHGAQQLVEWAAGRDRAPAVLARFRALYRAAPHGRTRVFDGLPATLDALAAQGKTLGVLSNKPHDLVVAIARELLARWPFAVVAGERSGIPRKPDPRAALVLLEQLGLPAADCVLVGDSEIDLETARAAGMPAVIVTWGMSEASALAARSPDHAVATPAELLQLFA